MYSREKTFCKVKITKLKIVQIYYLICLIVKAFLGIPSEVTKVNSQKNKIKKMKIVNLKVKFQSYKIKLRKIGFSFTW